MQFLCLTRNGLYVHLTSNLHLRTPNRPPQDTSPRSETKWAGLCQTLTRSVRFKFGRPFLRQLYEVESEASEASRSRFFDPGSITSATCM
jgi:hypothetical protein